MSTSKAEALGPSSAFSAATKRSRRGIFNQQMGIEEEAAEVVTHLPVEDISLNPDNPRRELGDLTDLAGSLRDHGQKTAITVMGRSAYLQANPGREEALEPRTRYVAIDGNSRLAAARQAGLLTIKVMVDDEMGSDRNELTESALVANVHRKDLDPLDEARALAQLLQVHKTQVALAERLHRTQAWVSQRLGLLNLTPELTERLKNGEEKAAHLRSVGNKKPEEQEAHLAAIKAKEEAVKAAKKQARQTLPTPQSDAVVAPGYNAVIGQAPLPEGGARAKTAAKQDAGTAQSSRLVPVPEQTATTAQPAQRVVEQITGAGERQGTVSPIGPRSAAEDEIWSDGAAIMDAAIRRLEEDQLSRLAVRCMAHVGTKERLATLLARATPYESREDLAALLQGAAELLRTPVK
ncbi:ParB/RepB/Spo0J family partition protein [Streptomyces sp. NPDC058700]|uniref:ParB/RepB/Spo0J family partition protein n=1 Tax=Streptomyces sp. NPDC058700 TaxID=3346607 RepID=UPI0036500C63